MDTKTISIDAETYKLLRRKRRAPRETFSTVIRRLVQEDVRKTADIYRQTVARQFLQEKKEMVQKLRQYGIQAILTKPQDLTLNTINKYLELKSRGLI